MSDYSDEEIEEESPADPLGVIQFFHLYFYIYFVCFYIFNLFLYVLFSHPLPPYFILTTNTDL